MDYNPSLIGMNDERSRRFKCNAKIHKERTKGWHDKRMRKKEYNI